MQRIIIVTLLVFFSITNATAADTQSATAAKIGQSSATQKWLELQRSGVAATTQDQPISGEVMDRTHQRYLKSFEKPIPEYYKHDSPVTR